MVRDALQRMRAATTARIAAAATPSLQPVGTAAVRKESATVLAQICKAQNDAAGLSVADLAQRLAASEAEVGRLRNGIGAGAGLPVEAISEMGAACLGDKGRGKGTSVTSNRLELYEQPKTEDEQTRADAANL